HLHDVLTTEGARVNMQCCLGGSGGLFGDAEPSPNSVSKPTEEPPGPVPSAEIGPWDPLAALPVQARTAWPLQDGLGAAAARLRLPPQRQVTCEELADLLVFVWRNTGLQQLRLERLPARQLTLPHA